MKRMGQLNPEPFLPAVMKKHRLTKSKAEIKAMQLCSVWEENIGDVQWHPFKVDESDGIPKVWNFYLATLLSNLKRCVFGKKSFLFTYYLNEIPNVKMQRVVDKNDQKLLKLKEEYGEEVYNEVVRTKLEIEDYNASGSYVVQELWNYEENRKATMEEATDVMLNIRSNIAAKRSKRKILRST